MVLPPNQKIVDVATGTGTLAYELAKLGHSVVGIEPRNHWAAKLAFPLVRASESTNWLPFINRGLESLLHEVNLRVSRRITYLGVIQIVVIDC